MRQCVMIFKSRLQSRLAVATIFWRVGNAAMGRDLQVEAAVQIGSSNDILEGGECGDAS